MYSNNIFNDEDVARSPGHWVFSIHLVGFCCKERRTGGCGAATLA